MITNIQQFIDKLIIYIIIFFEYHMNIEISKL